MQKDKIIELLKDHPVKEEVEKFAAYIVRLYFDEKNGKRKNYWLQNKKEPEMADLFRRVAKDGLVFDGESITLISTGISYNYQAYKNKMLNAYPESKIDVSLVYKEDQFEVGKISGAVEYTHKVANPFAQKDGDIIGAYCVIQNKRGEFLTTMSPEDIAKHRKVAKTDYIWAAWFKEMCMKTVIKKACRTHFKDMYENIEAIDNENNDITIPVTIDLKWKQEIDDLKDIEELRSYYMENKGRGKDFDLYISKRKNQLTQPAHV